MAYHLIESPNRTTLKGFHGTDGERAARILHQGFVPSTGAGEWLGHGIYFWDSLDAAWLWAEKRHQSSPAVVSATFMLGYCLDLDNVADLQPFIRELHEELEAELTKKGLPLPENVGDELALDCMILNRAAESTHPEVDSLVRTFQGGDPLYRGSTLYGGTRRQYCVRAAQNIWDAQLEHRSAS